MPANGRWDLIRRLKIKQVTHQVHHNKLYGQKRKLRFLLPNL